MDKCPFCEFDNRSKCVNWGKVKFTETTASADGKRTHLTEAQYKKWRNENCKDRQIAQLEERLEAWREVKSQFAYVHHRNDIDHSHDVTFYEGTIRKLLELGEI